MFILLAVLPLVQSHGGLLNEFWEMTSEVYDYFIPYDLVIKPASNLVELEEGSGLNVDVGATGTYRYPICDGIGNCSPTASETGKCTPILPKNLLDRVVNQIGKVLQTECRCPKSNQMTGAFDDLCGQGDRCDYCQPAQTKLYYEPNEKGINTQNLWCDSKAAAAPDEGVAAGVDDTLLTCYDIMDRDYQLQCSPGNEDTQQYGGWKIQVGPGDSGSNMNFLEICHTGRKPWIDAANSFMIPPGVNSEFTHYTGPAPVPYPDIPSRPNPAMIKVYWLPSPPPTPAPTPETRADSLVQRESPAPTPIEEMEDKGAAEENAADNTVSDGNADADWECTSYSTSRLKGTNEERCDSETRNALNDGFIYRYNKGRINKRRGADVPGECGVGGCWCCKKKRSRR